LEQRFGTNAYKTGASFFLISKTIGAAARLYVVAIILQTVVFNPWNIPFELTVCILIFLIWLYTYKSGIKTIVWTDTVQALIMIVALILLVVQLANRIQPSETNLFTTLFSQEHFRVFVFDDWHSKQNFFKQFLSGIFIAVVMTGLDQDMMQKNLTCRSLSDAKKNMYWYGMSFIPVNFLFLILGLMLLMLSAQLGIALPSKSDEILPLFATNYLGQSVFVLFVLGIISAAFSSADSALASLTTSFAVDIMNVQHESDKNAIRKRRYIHVGISIVFALIILIFQAINNRSVIDAIYVIASYTYGPLLGLFAFGLYTKRIANDKLIPFIAVFSPVFCYVLNILFDVYLSYKFGYELLMLNGFITFVALWFSSKPLDGKPE
jgi:Na+/proline symporter